MLVQGGCSGVGAVDAMVSVATGAYGFLQALSHGSVLLHGGDPQHGPEREKEISPDGCVIPQAILNSLLQFPMARKFPSSSPALYTSSVGKTSSENRSAAPDATASILQNFTEVVRLELPGLGFKSDTKTAEEQGPSNLIGL
ncbi:hypothetical protein INR49_025283 [Caranx melampygus]|nr:hypothetical protein INR49_025283 [Caranx melampygus]